jgi:soluble lytic murein transglycosylase-like protein
MSAQPLTVGAPGEGVVARIAQIEALIAQARAVASGQSTAPAQPTGGGEGFAGALQSAISSGGEAGGASTAAISSGGEAGSYEGLITQAAARYGIDPAVLHGLIQQESGFDPNAQSAAGAMGLTQLMPGTASAMGVSNPLDPAQAIEGGARYLSQLLGQFGGNTTDALAAYNAGPGAVSQYGGVPPYAETQSYVEKVLAYAQEYRGTHATAGVPA